MPLITEDQAKKIGEKGWSLSYIYAFVELKDIYLALQQHDYEGIKDFFQYCQSIDLKAQNKVWSERKTLEFVNALKNFKIIDHDYKIVKDIFKESKIGDAINESDFNEFYSIFFEYFRFKEVLMWFLGEKNIANTNLMKSLSIADFLENSNVLFCFSDKSRFTDSFFYELIDNPTIYYLSEDNTETENNSGFLRFWDTFTTWGKNIRVIEKLNLTNIPIKTLTGKNITCVYIRKNKPKHLDFINYIKIEYKNSNYIFIPHLVLKLVIDFRITVQDAFDIIIEQYKIHKQIISFERTSGIFVKKTEINKNDTIFYPKYNDSFISHLIIRE